MSSDDAVITAIGNVLKQKFGELRVRLETAELRVKRAEDRLDSALDRLDVLEAMAEKNEAVLRHIDPDGKQRLLKGLDS